MWGPFKYLNRQIYKKVTPVNINWFAVYFHQAFSLYNFTLVNLTPYSVATV